MWKIVTDFFLRAKQWQILGHKMGNVAQAKQCEKVQWEYHGFRGGNAGE
jgi:hypothetical protein